jgi:hypothetical protein
MKRTFPRIGMELPLVSYRYHPTLQSPQGSSVLAITRHPTPEWESSIRAEKLRGNAETTPASILVFAFLYLTIFPYLQFTKPHRAVIIAYFGFAPSRTTRKPSSAYTHQELDFSGSLATFEASGGRWLVDISIHFRTRSSYQCLISLLAFQSKLNLTMPRVMLVESLALLKQKEQRYEFTDKTTKDEKLQLSFLLGFAIFAIFKLRQL